MAEFNPYNHFGFLTNRVARLVVKEIEPQMKEMGYEMPPSCIGIMADLWKKDGVIQKELATALIKNKSAITKMLAILEKEGLIEKRIVKEDKRNKRIFLTKSGKELRFKIEARAAKMEKKFVGEHSAEDIETAKRVLKTIYLKLSESISTKNK